MEDPEARAVTEQLEADLKHAAVGDWAALGLDAPAAPAFAPASIADLLTP